MASDSVPNSDAPTEARRKLCRFFQEGKCEKGEDCPFKHEKAGGKKICVFFASKGGCKKGADCPFIHEKAGNE